MDLAARRCLRRGLQEILETAHVDKQCPVEAVATMLDSLRRPGKRGVRALTAALDEVGPGEGMARSELEALLDQVIELSGLPAPLHERHCPRPVASSGSSIGPGRTPA